jgi:hypothetical protein
VLLAMNASVDYSISKQTMTAHLSKHHTREPYRPQFLTTAAAVRSLPAVLKEIHLESAAHTRTQ